MKRSKHSPDKVSLSDLFTDLQDRLYAALAGSRKTIKHPGAKGQGSELNWQKMLADHLPARYQVTTGFLIDHEGTLSEQIDVVIFDRQYTPFMLNRDGVQYIPAEGVYAVFEVRQELNKRNLGYAASKARSVRKLKRTSVAIQSAGGRLDAPEPNHILAGILTLDSNWREPFGGPFYEVIKSLDHASQLDLGICLKHDSFEISWGARSPSYAVSAKGRALIFFFMRLLARLQDIGTVRAMDFDLYSDWLANRSEEQGDIDGNAKRSNGTPVRPRRREAPGS